MAGKKTSFRIGRVRGDLRGKVWYLTYYENGTRHRPRVGPKKEAAKQLAAQINSQLEVGAPAALSFEPIPIAELRQRWLEHHEQVLRSSVQTIRRYRAATQHLIDFLETGRCPQKTSLFRGQHAEEFVRYLRTVQIAPNGHKNARKRPLFDRGIKYILLTCRSLFNYAIKRRHLSPYAETPFANLDLDRMPVEDAKPVSIFTAEQERAFLDACDDWQLPVFLTLMLAGLRPGELTHLLLPDDLDLDGGWLRVRNKPELGWRIKTGNERDIPLTEPLVQVLQWLVGSRTTGPVFLRRRYAKGERPPLAGRSVSGLKHAVAKRVAQREQEEGQSLDRSTWQSVARTVWRDAGAIKTTRIRVEFMRLTKRIGAAHLTAPKLLRHLFATCLQEGNVDPLIRCELMGHSATPKRGSGHGLAMTAAYTQTRPETKQRQLAEAMKTRPAVSKLNPLGIKHRI